MNDKLHALAEDIWTQVHDLVDGLIGDLSSEDDAEIREHLNETFRFWRQ